MRTVDMFVQGFYELGAEMFGAKRHYKVSPRIIDFIAEE